MHAQDEVFASSLLLSEGALLPSIGIAPLKIRTYPCTLTPAPLHSHPNRPPQAPPNTPPLRTANNRVLLPTRTASRSGVCVHPCPFAAHGGSRAVSRIGYPICTRHTWLSAYSASASGSRTHSKKATLSIKTRRLLCNDAAYGCMHSGQGDVVMEFVRVLVEG